MCARMRGYVLWKLPVAILLHRTCILTTARKAMSLKEAGGPVNNSFFSLS